MNHIPWLRAEMMELKAENAALRAGLAELASTRQVACAPTGRH